MIKNWPIKRKLIVKNKVVALRSYRFCFSFVPFSEGTERNERKPGFSANLRPAKKQSDVSPPVCCVANNQVGRGASQSCSSSNVGSIDNWQSQHFRDFLHPRFYCFVSFCIGSFLTSYYRLLIVQINFSVWLFRSTSTDTQCCGVVWENSQLKWGLNYNTNQSIQWQ